MFVIPGASCLLLLMMSRVMPESPRWLAARGRDVEADAVVRKFERHQRIEAVNSPAPFTASDASAMGSASPPISYLRLLVVACVRWEERRVGKECVSTWSSGWATYN